MLGLDFTVMASSFEEREQVDPTATPAEQVMAAAGEGGRGFSPYSPRSGDR